MKKSFIITAIAILVGFTFTACEKQKLEKEIQKHTIESTLKVNESVTFTLPIVDKKDAYQITSLASHASISRLRINPDGSTEYLYTPENNYVGQDEIVITTIENEKTGGHHSQPKNKNGIMAGVCSKNNEQGELIEVTVKLTIQKEASKVVTSTKAIVGSN